MLDPGRLPESMVGLAEFLGKIPSPQEAFRLFGQSTRIAVARREGLVMDQAERFSFVQGGDTISGYKWGEDRFVLLLHGWGARASTMTAFVEPLRAAGFGVIAFDHPGHGESGGDFCHALRVCECIQLAREQVGSFVGALSHSFGSLGLTFALDRHTPIPKAVLVSPLCLIPQRFRQFAVACGLSPAGVEEMMEISDDFFGPGLLENNSVHQVAPRLRTEALVIHDEGDREVLPEEANLIVQAWPKAQLWLTQGLGHFRILRDRLVVQRAVEFLAD